MATCEISGKTVPKTITIRIEGVVMHVAPEYASMGSEIKHHQPAVRPRKTSTQQAEPTVMLDADYGHKVKEARERKNLRQEDLAKMMMEKASTIQHVETGTLRPSEQLVIKFRKYLGIDLMLTMDEDDTPYTEHQETQKMTLGDLMKQKI